MNKPPHAAKIDAPLYNSRIIDTYIKLIRRKYNFINLIELLQYAGMKPYQVADQGHWFTQGQIDRFHERLVQLTGEENVAREAGRFAASPEAIGVMRQYVLGMVGPTKVFEHLEKTTANFTRSSVYLSKKLASNKFEINVIPQKGIRENPFQCENRIGFFEAIPLGFNISSAQIEHPECIFKGGKVCRYLISWEKTATALWKRIRNISGLILSLMLISYLFIDYYIAVSMMLPGSIIGLLILTLIADRMEKKELNTSLHNLRESTDNLVKQIEINYNNSQMINEVGQAISKATNIEDVLKQVIQILNERLDYDRSLILLANRDKTRLDYRAGYGYNKEQLTLLENTAFNLNKSGQKGVFVVSFREQLPFLVNDFNDIEDTLSPKSLDFAKKIGAKSFICCPIIFDEESLGILAVDNLKSKKALVQSDMSLIMGIAPVIGISIRNASLLEAKARQFNSTIQALAASIDARDPLTSGHSERVTEYAIGICRELNLSTEYIEMIRVAALLHDYGKIGVPDSILKKQGPLTEDEVEIIRQHARKTKEILREIDFEGIFKQIPETAGSHHEKIDGSGYPEGLNGDEIMLGAKIIAVADYFEAITSKRHYREPMPLDQAFKLLRERRGKHFEEKLVEAFCKYYEKAHEDIQLLKAS
jgi:putative nucleotidyltransferase with HDIG domain